LCWISSSFSCRYLSFFGDLFFFTIRRVSLPSLSNWYRFPVFPLPLKCRARFSEVWRGFRPHPLLDVSYFFVPALSHSRWPRSPSRVVSITSPRRLSIPLVCVVSLYFLFSIFPSLSYESPACSVARSAVLVFTGYYSLKAPPCCFVWDTPPLSPQRRHSSVRLVFPIALCFGCPPSCLGLCPPSSRSPRSLCTPRRLFQRLGWILPCFTLGDELFSIRFFQALLSLLSSPPFTGSFQLNRSPSPSVCTFCFFFLTQCYNRESSVIFRGV